MWCILSMWSRRRLCGWKHMYSCMLMTAWMSSALHAALNNRTDARHLQGSGVLWWASLCMILPYRNAIRNDVVVLYVCVRHTKAGSACFQDVFLEDWVGKGGFCQRLLTYPNRSGRADLSRLDFFSLCFSPPLHFFFMLQVCQSMQWIFNVFLSLEEEKKAQNCELCR